MEGEGEKETLVREREVEKGGEGRRKAKKSAIHCENVLC